MDNTTNDNQSSNTSSQSNISNDNEVKSIETNLREIAPEIQQMNSPSQASSMSPTLEATQTVQPAEDSMIDNVSNIAQTQIQDVSQNAQKAVTAGVDQLQQVGQAGFQKMGSVVGQVLQPKKEDENQPPVNKDEKVYAAIAYFPFVALISIIVKPDSSFVRLHSKQGLLLAILFFSVGIMAAIVSLFGIIGQFLAVLLGLVPLATIVIGVYSMYLAFSGYWWKIPVLGTVADIIPVEWMAKTSKENITGQIGVAKVDYDERKDVIKQEMQEAQAPITPVVDLVEPIQPTPTVDKSLEIHSQQNVLTDDMKHDQAEK